MHISSGAIQKDPAGIIGLRLLKRSLAMIPNEIRMRIVIAMISTVLLPVWPPKINKRMPVAVHATSARLCQKNHWRIEQFIVSIDDLQERGFICRIKHRFANLWVHTCEDNKGES
jgi:hypothetical protein